MVSIALDIAFSSFWIHFPYWFSASSSTSSAMELAILQEVLDWRASQLNLSYYKSRTFKEIIRQKQEYTINVLVVKSHKTNTFAPFLIVSILFTFIATLSVLGFGNLQEEVFLSKI